MSDAEATTGAWRPIETAPRDGSGILVCRARDADGRRMTEDAWDVFVQVAMWWDRWVVYCSLVRDPDLHFEPTHWMPLPGIPGGEDDHGL